VIFFIQQLVVGAIAFFFYLGKAIFYVTRELWRMVWGPRSWTST
jgi:hypothetical protein